MTQLQDQSLILVVDDELNIRKSIELVLSQEDFKVIHAENAIKALEHLKSKNIDLVIMDIRLGDIDGLTAFKKMLQLNITIPCIFMSGNSTLTEAAKAVQLGAFDFIEKPFNADRLLTTSKRALEFYKIKTQLDWHEQQNKFNKHDIIGESDQLKQILIKSTKAAKSEANVLICGESGTGKELLCNYIHSQSNRADQALIKVNCAAIPETLFESEMFGYEKGAFTGAVNLKRGSFELAHRGTLFLDEIADLNLTSQAKLLRVLQSGEIKRLGSEKSLLINSRVIAATHKNLKHLVEIGEFREDLFYRLSVIPLTMPSLRDRKEDFPLLFYFLVEKIQRKNNLTPRIFSPDIIAQIQHYQWPGNIRELENVLERVLILNEKFIEIEHFPDEILNISNISSTLDTSNLTIKNFRDKAEKEYIISTLHKNSGNISQTATQLGMARSYLHKRLVQLGITKMTIFAN